MDSNIELKFHTVYQESEGVHVATCIEMGLVATADRKEDLSAIMSKLISRQITFALKNDNFQDIFHPAQLAWQFLRDATAKQKARARGTTIEPVDGSTITLNNTAYDVAC